jgi:DNA polymerase III alpha subunit
VGLEPGLGLALLSAESYFGRGVSSPERLLERAAALGHTHLALTDWQSLDLVLLTGGREGFPSRLLAERRLLALDRLLKALKETFRDRLFLSLYHDLLPGDARRARILRALAQDRGLPYVAALEVRMAETAGLGGPRGPLPREARLRQAA